jgi:hypothetical protein
MPWCEPCAKYWTPNAMNVDGTCPSCGDVVEDQHDHAAAEAERTPWHFKLLVATVALYVGWRVIQLVGGAL